MEFSRGRSGLTTAGPGPGGAGRRVTTPRPCQPLTQGHSVNSWQPWNALGNWAGRSALFKSRQWPGFPCPRCSRCFLSMPGLFIRFEGSTSTGGVGPSRDYFGDPPIWLLESGGKFQAPVLTRPQGWVHLRRWDVGILGTSGGNRDHPPWDHMEASVGSGHVPDSWF